jgi:septin family protein
MNTVFNTNFNLQPSTHNEPKVVLNSNSFELNENGVKLKLTLIETSGYGDQINKQHSHEEILKYLDDKFELYVQEELNVKRNFRQINDSRVHLCLYFICPTGHSLKALDLNTMKALDKKVNIVPIIAKADTISKTELVEFKRQIMQELTNNEVNIYKFPIDDYDPNVNSFNSIANVSEQIH